MKGVLYLLTGILQVSSAAFSVLSFLRVRCCNSWFGCKFTHRNNLFPAISVDTQLFQEVPIISQNSSLCGYFLAWQCFNSNYRRNL